MTAHDLTVWDQAWRAGAIFGSLVGVAFGTVAVWYAGQLINQLRARRAARADAAQVEAVERDLIRRTGLTWPALYDQDQDRRWQR